MSERHENPIPRQTHALLEHLKRYKPRTPDYEAVKEMILDHAAISEYVQRQEENIATMVEESNEREREINRLRRLIPAAMRDAEEKLAEANNDVGRVCAAFNAQRDKTDALRKESVREFFIPARRQAAGAWTDGSSSETRVHRRCDGAEVRRRTPARQ